ncbi:MAG: hypothetical protein IJE10_10930 [Clostridia bacterium]|nr:hypothetical protein [Clostridia bacterium]
MRKLVSLLLTICMVLSVVPAMAATITIEDNMNYLKAPVSLSYGSTGASSGYAGYSGETVSFVLQNGGEVAEALGFKLEKGLKISAYNTGNDFDGLVVNADITYTGTAAMQNADGSLVYEEDGTTIKMEEFSYTYKLVDAPVIGFRANNAGTALVLEINGADYYDETGTTKIGVTRRYKDAKAKLFTEKLSNAVLSNKSQSIGSTYNTGKFPEGTIFISVTEFDNESDSVWPGNLADCGSMVNNEHKYKVWDENNAAMTTGLGPSAVFKSKVAGTYDIWVMRADLDKTNDTTRPAKFYIDNVLYNSTARPDDFAGTGAKDRYFFWSKQDGATVTLAKNQKIKVQCAQQSDTYCRLAMIALVPSNAAIDLPLTSTDIYSGPTAISQDTAVALRALYLDKVILSKDAVKATVNGTEYDVVASEINTDIFGDDILTPTVADAIKAAGLTAKADGTTAEYITVNGKEVVNAHKIPLQANDVITVSEATLNAFSPVSVEALFAACGSSYTTGVPTKLCLNPTAVHNAKLNFALTYAEDGSYVENETDGEGLMGAYITGYVQNTTDYTLNGVTVPANSKQIIAHPAGHKITSFVASSNNRLDFNVSNLAYKDRENAMTLMPGSTTTATWMPYRISSTPKLNKTNLYLVDANTTFKVEVTKRDNKFALSSDGTVTAKLFVINCGNDGKMTSVATIEDVVITPLTPYVGTVSDNQTVYVWNTTPYAGADAPGGTEMIPLCDPITKE